MDELSSSIIKYGKGYGVSLDLWTDNRISGEHLRFDKKRQKSSIYASNLANSLMTD